MMATYYLTTAAKLREIEDGCSGEECREKYSRIAEEYLREYECRTQPPVQR
jgi:hypothetical protein